MFRRNSGSHTTKGCGFSTEEPHFQYKLLVTSSAYTTGKQQSLMEKETSSFFLERGLFFPVFSPPQEEKGVAGRTILNPEQKEFRNEP